MGKLKPNTLMLGFKGDWQKCAHQSVVDYVQILQWVSFDTVLTYSLEWYVETEFAQIA